jgi:hypothetical protein
MSNTLEGAEAYMQTYKLGASIVSPWIDYNLLTTWGWEKTLPSRYKEGTYKNILDNYITNILQISASGSVPVKHVQDIEV